MTKTSYQWVIEIGLQSLIQQRVKIINRLILEVKAEQLEQDLLYWNSELPTGKKDLEEKLRDLRQQLAQK